MVLSRGAMILCWGEPSVLTGSTLRTGRAVPLQWCGFLPVPVAEAMDLGGGATAMASRIHQSADFHAGAIR